MIRFIKRLMCRHEFTRIRTIHGDEINWRNGMRSEWVCQQCDKRQYSKYLDKI